MPTSEVSLYKIVLRVVRRTYGHTPAAEFGPRCLKALLQEMIRMGWCRKSINKHAARVKHVFKWAVEKGDAGGRAKRETERRIRCRSRLLKA